MNIAKVGSFRNAVSAFLPSVVLTVFAAAIFCSVARAQTPAAKAGTAPARSRVTAAAVWNPSADALAVIRTKCEADPDRMETCFLAEMKSAGASPEAVAFARSMAGTGVIYLRALRSVARVDVAYIQYVFRANELEGVLLVNGNPSPIDVDDDSQYPTAELQKYAAYAALANQYPNISIRPGDRNDPQLPKLDSGEVGRQTFLVEYILRDGCHACATIGSATFAYAFDGDGNFQGARVFAVKPVGRHTQAVVGPEFETAGVEQVRVLAGKDFSITLPANHTTGYSWRLSTTLDPADLKLVGTTYTERQSDSSAVGAPGEEVWRFTAGAVGTVPLLFEYARPFEKDAKPVKTSKFLVVIE